MVVLISVEAYAQSFRPYTHISDNLAATICGEMGLYMKEGACHDPALSIFPLPSEANSSVPG